jgi:hypothetical protein
MERRKILNDRDGKGVLQATVVVGLGTEEHADDRKRIS